MIHALRASVRRPDLRRIAGLVLLVAFACVLVAGAAHAGLEAGSDHDHCSVCTAATLARAPLFAAAPALPAEPPPLPGARVVKHAALREFEPRRIAAPRGPPVPA